jgi:hypothetical protein
MAEHILFYTGDSGDNPELFKKIITNNLVFTNKKPAGGNIIPLKDNILYLCHLFENYEKIRYTFYEERKFKNICVFYYITLYSKDLIEQLKNENPELIKIFYIEENFIVPNLKSMEFSDNLYSHGLLDYEIKKHSKYIDYEYFSKIKPEKLFTFTFIPFINNSTEYDPDTTLLQNPTNTNTPIDEFTTNINSIKYVLQITKINDIYIDSDKIHLFNDIFYLNSDYLLKKNTINFKFITILSKKENNKIIIKQINYSELKYHKINTDFFLYHNINTNIKTSYTDGIIKISFNKNLPSVPLFKEPPLSKKKNIIIYI